MPKVSSLSFCWRQEIIPYLVGALTVAADQLSKLWVRTNLPLGSPLPHEGFLHLTYTTNRGVLLGLFPNHIIISVISVVVIVVLLYFYHRNLLPHQHILHIGVGLLLGGTIGNLIDRFSLGYVVDFIDIRLWGDFHWPIFNIADCAIVGGVALLAYCLIKADYEKSS